jgi:hypothetical protein
MISILVGLVFIAAGIAGIVRWFPDFLGAVRGLAPLSLLLGGIVAVIVGVGSLSGRKRPNEKKK